MRQRWPPAPANWDIMPTILPTAPSLSIKTGDSASSSCANCVNKPWSNRRERSGWHQSAWGCDSGSRDIYAQIRFAGQNFCAAKNGSEVLIKSGWPFCITPCLQVFAMLVSEVVSAVVGEAVWRHHPKPKPLPIPKQTKPKSQNKPKSRRKPRPFNEPKPEELS